MSTYQPDPAEMVAFLNHTAFFKDLSPTELKVIASAVKILAFEAGSVIVRQGEQAKDFFIVAQGKAQVVVEDATLGTDTVLLELGPFDSFGEMSLLCRGPRSATVRALEKTVCLALSGPDFEVILEQMPQAAIPLSRYLASRLMGQQMLGSTVELRPEHFDRDVYGLLTPSLAERLNAVPLKLDGDLLHVAMTRPTDPGCLEELRLAVPGLKVKPVTCELESYRRFLREVVHPALRSAGSKSVVGRGRVKATAALGPELEALVGEALDQGASELVLQADKAALRVQGRLIPLEGERDWSLVPRQAREVCGLSGERPSPWGGSACLQLEGEGLLDLRFSSVPTHRGERLLARLIPSDHESRTLEELLPSDTLLGAIRATLRRPGGLLLVCGPARSGRTATLYAALRDLQHHSPELSLATVEEEIEWTLEGTTQCLVGDRGYPEMIRSVLRQLPDLLMVGEIRDSHTAILSLETALTCCSVMTSMFAEDTTRALLRLGSMGAPPFLLGSAVEVVLGQVLVRSVCPACREAYTVSPTVQEQLKARGLVEDDQAPLFHGRGCDECHQTGYAGQMPAVELLKMDSAVRDALVRGDAEPRLREVARESGALAPFRQSLAVLLRQGKTSPTEALRVLQSRA